MDTYRHLITCSRWLLLIYALWLPASLLAHPGLVADKNSSQEDTIRKGMGVFGNVLGIHGTDTLALQGDLVLVEAEIVGDGILSLCASQSQRIVAQRSSVQNLHIANPTRVVVQGDLEIQKSLVIEKGVVDCQIATLTLSDTCRFRIEKAGQILWHENLLLVKQSKAIPQPRPTPSANWATIWYEIIDWKRGRLSILIRFAHRPFKALQEENIPPSPPPEPLLKLLPLAGSNKHLAGENLTKSLNDKNYEV